MSPAEGNFDRKGSLRAGRRRREGSGAVDQGQTFGIEIGFAARPQQNNRRHASGSIENKPNRSDPFGALKCTLGIMLHTLQHSADNEAVAHRFTAAFGWQRDGGGTKNDPGPNRKATPASLRPPSGFQRRAAPFPLGRLHARFLGPHCLCETAAAPDARFAEAGDAAGFAPGPALDRGLFAALDSQSIPDCCCNAVPVMLRCL